jgi:hypothetical protein
MGHTETYSARTENPPPFGLTLPGLAALGKKRVEELARAQADLLITMKDAHRRWFDRMESEARLASEFTRKVTSCRSIPDAVTACQEWTGRRLEMMADDGKRLLVDSQRMMETGARLLSDGLFADGHHADGLHDENAEAPRSGANRERVLRPAPEPDSGEADAAWSENKHF